MGTPIKAQDTRRLARVSKVAFVPDNDEMGKVAAVRWWEAEGME